MSSHFVLYLYGVNLNLHYIRPWLQSMVVATCSLLFLWPAFYNGYPLVNPDAATYLASGFIPETPIDRPITYGLLIRLFSLNGFSLWTVVFAQALLLAWSVTSIIKQFVGNRYYVYSVLIICFLSFCSGLPWLASQVQPDVFTPIAILCIARLFIGGCSKAQRIGIYSLFTISVAVHMSHPLIMGGTVLCVYLLQGIVARGQKWVHAIPISLFVLSFACLAAMGAALSKSKHVFLMASLVEKGVVKKYLNDNCAAGSYKLCAYQNQLPPTLSEFMWASYSPLYKVGDWSGSKKEFNGIISDILTTPKYLLPFLQASASVACRQLATFAMGDGNTVFLPASVLSQRITTYIPREGMQFQSSRQNRGMLLQVFALPSIISFWFVALSLLVLMGYIRHMPPPFYLLVLTCIAAILIHTADTAIFSCLQDRYGCRVMWLLPFCAGCCLIIHKHSRSGTHI